MEHAEKRKQVRVSFQAPIVLQWRGEQHRGVGTVSNMSQAGCYILTQHPALVDDNILVRVTDDLPEMTCRVRYVDPQVGMGVQFENLDAEAEQKLGTFLKAKAVLWA